MAACRRSALRTASSDTHGEGAEFARPDRVGFRCDGRHLLLGGSAAAWPLQQRRGGFSPDCMSFPEEAGACLLSRGLLHLSRATLLQLLNCSENAGTLAITLRGAGFGEVRGCLTGVQQRRPPRQILFPHFAALMRATCWGAVKGRLSAAKDLRFRCG